MGDSFTVEAKVGDEITLYRSDDLTVEGVRFVVHAESAEPIRLVVASLLPYTPGDGEAVQSS